MITINYLKSVKQYFYDCPNAELSLEIVSDLIAIILQLLQEKESSLPSQKK